MCNVKYCKIASAITCISQKKCGFDETVRYNDGNYRDQIVTKKSQHLNEKGRRIRGRRFIAHTRILEVL